MKNLKFGLILLLCLPAISAPKKKAAFKTKPVRPPVVSPKLSPVRKSMPSQNSVRALSEALNLMRNGQCEKAAPLLFSYSRRAEFQNEQAQIKYLLGQCLMEMKLNQVAAFQFVDIIRSGQSKYTKPAIEKLSLVADSLGDDTLLNYAISRVEVEDFPNQNKDIIYYRMCE